MENLLSMCNHAFFNTDTTAFVNYLKQQPCYPQDCLLNFNKLQTLENPYFRIQKLQELEQEAEQVTTTEEKEPQIEENKPLKRSKKVK